jgi:hypothetical protein
MNRASLLAIVLCSLLTSAAAAQACRPQLQVEPPVVDQWALEQLAAGSGIRIPFQLSVTARGEDCPFLATFDFAHSQQVQVHVEPRPFGQALLDLSASDPRRILAGVASGDVPSSFELDLVVTPVRQPDARRINVQMTVRLYSGTGPADAVEIDRLRQRVVLDIPAMARLNVRSDVGDGSLGSAPAFLELGDLVSGGRRRAFLTLEGNVPVTVRVVATHGVLIHTEFPEFSAPYSIALGAAEGPASAAYETRLEPGESIVLEVGVGELESLVAGDYQDILQITMEVD